MKPRTKLQKRVDELSQTLPQITDIQKDWAYNNCFKAFVYKTKAQSFCLDCGHSWDNKTIFLFCPQCGKKLNNMPNKAYTKKTQEYMSIMTVVKEFQLIRYFFVEQYCRKGQAAQYYIEEVYQHWITDKGHITFRAIGTNAFGFTRAWRYGSNMEIRPENQRYYCWNAKIYPKKKLLPVIRRNGYRNKLYGYDAGYFFSFLLSSSIFETLVKLKQDAFIQEYTSREDKYKIYWNSMKVCFRNNYKVTDVKTWLDQLEILELFQKDLYNPKYVCPIDLHKEHQRWIKKRHEYQKKQRKKELIKQIAKDNIAYQQRIKNFLGLKFTNGVIEVTVLNSVEDFYNEGNLLNHCVFTNSYHKRENSLLLSARKGDERLETIEFNLQKFAVEQARGKNNKNTRYHKTILSLINSNIKTIKQCTKKQQLIEV